MKVVIFNYSGNAGKTTLAKIISDEYPEMKVITLESVNQGVNGEKLRADDDFKRVQDELFDSDDLLLDVGASNAENFILNLKKYPAVIEDIDLFVVPIRPDIKLQDDALLSLRVLSEIGVQPDAIKVVFNDVGDRKVPEQEFATIFAEHDITGNFLMRKDAWIPSTGVFEHIKLSGEPLTLQYAATKEASEKYKAAVKTEADPIKKEMLREALYACRSAAPVMAKVKEVLKFICN